jgi:hypothetical protein
LSSPNRLSALCLCWAAIPILLLALVRIGKHFLSIVLQVVGEPSLLWPVVARGDAGFIGCRGAHDGEKWICPLCNNNGGAELARREPWLREVFGMVQCLLGASRCVAGPFRRRRRGLMSNQGCAKHHTINGVAKKLKVALAVFLLRRRLGALIHWHIHECIHLYPHITCMLAYVSDFEF